MRALLLLLLLLCGCQSPDPAEYPDAYGRSRAGYDPRYDPSAPPFGTQGGQPIFEACSECAASGYCGYCLGSGWSRTQFCPPCEGTGRCLFCAGMGERLGPQFWD